MIAWSIEAAKRANIFDKIIVSTDDDEIAEISRSWGAEVPFIRSAELSDDYTGTIPVVVDAIYWCIDSGLDPNNVCCIYPTAPFVQSADIIRGLEILNHQKCEFTFSVTSYAFPIERSIFLNSEGRVKMTNPEKFSIRSQDLKENYHDAGQFYWGTQAAWLSGKPLFGIHSSPVILPRYRVQDIDTLEDWKYAELMFKALLET